MFSAIGDIENSKYGRYGHYLHEQHFWGTVLLAFLLHLGGIALYHLMPNAAVEEIPVRVLNVKLGGVRLPEATQPANSFSAAVAEFASRIENAQEIPLEEVSLEGRNSAVSALEQQFKPSAKKSPSPSKPSKSHSLQETLKHEPPAKRYFRDETAKAQSKDQADTAGSPEGNSTDGSAEVRNRYTQTLSLWIDKNKIYPNDARLRGEGGQVLLRIRINRQGRIIRYFLEKSSGHDSIDRAISMMVDAANPVPPVPDNYPDPRAYLEFIIPINFRP